MTKKKHKVLPAEMLDAVKYEIALELGLIPRVQPGGCRDKADESVVRGSTDSTSDEPSSSPNR